MVTWRYLGFSKRPSGWRAAMRRGRRGNYRFRGLTRRISSYAGPSRSH